MILPPRTSTDVELSRLDDTTYALAVGEAVVALTTRAVEDLIALVTEYPDGTVAQVVHVDREHQDIQTLATFTDGLVAHIGAYDALDRNPTDVWAPPATRHTWNPNRLTLAVVMNGQWTTAHLTRDAGLALLHTALHESGDAS